MKKADKSAKGDEQKTSDYHFWLSQGICPNCHKRMVAPGRHSCLECLAKIRKREADYRRREAERRKSDPDYVDKHVESRRQAVTKYRERHKAMGLCICCGRPALPGIQLCAYHRQKTAYQNNLRKYGGRKRPPREHLDAPTPSRKVKTDVGKLFALYNAGWRVVDIADELRTTESSVYRWIGVARKEKEDTK